MCQELHLLTISLATSFILHTCTWFGPQCGNTLCCWLKSMCTWNKDNISQCHTVKADIQVLHKVLLAFEKRILFAAYFEDFSPWLDPDVSCGPTLDYGQQKYSWLPLWHVCKYLHTVKALIQLWNLSAELGHPYEIKSI